MKKSATRARDGVPFLDLSAHHRPLLGAFRRKVDKIFRSSEFILGRDVELFEQEFGAFLKVGHAVGVSNGTDALRLACEAIDLRPGDEVLVPANTYVATALGVTHAGGTPKFVDVTPDTFTMDPSRVEEAITPRTRALIPVHLFGHPADLGPLLEIARRRSLKVIEDTAQAHGATWEGRPVGGIADLGCFSFYPSKNLGALGDGGLVATNDPALAERLRMLRHMGQRRKYVHEIIGYNNRLDNLQAALLRIKLPRLQKSNRQRQAAAKLYAKALAGTDAVLPSTRPGCSHVYHIYSIRHPRRDRVREALEKAGIGCGVYYPVPVPYQDCYRDLGHRKGDFPVTEQLAADSLALPMFPELTARQVERVAQVLRSV
ncbi:MAG: DegT/DnrJ/EryC1/StrS family aminotransferase [Planctomycetaceae bacterium]|nr:DegT/DnrJ/EryC1/StrS family aminotransferase [Planctomycetaceae bacterium]